MKVYIAVGVLLMSLWVAEAMYASPVQHFLYMVGGTDANKAKALKDKDAELKKKYAGQCKEVDCTLGGNQITCKITSCTEAYNHPFGYGDCAPARAFIAGCYMVVEQNKWAAYPKCCRKVIKHCKGDAGFQERLAHCKNAPRAVA